MLLQGVISAIRGIKINFSTRELPSPKKDKCQLEKKIVSDCGKNNFQRKLFSTNEKYSQNLSFWNFEFYFTISFIKLVDTL